MIINKNSNFWFYLFGLSLLFFTNNIAKGNNSLADLNCCNILENYIKKDSFLIDEFGVNGLFDLEEIEENNNFLKPSEEVAESDNLSISDFDYDNKLIKLGACVNEEKQYWFILDSGAPTVFKSNVVNELGLWHFNASSLADATGNAEEVKEYRVKKFNIAGKKYKNVKVLSNHRVEEMPVIQSEELSGLIGANLMSNAVWMINFKTKKVLISDNMKQFNIPAYAHFIPLKTDEIGRPIVEVFISATIKKRFIVDFGYNGSVLLPASFMNKPLFEDSLTYLQETNYSAGFTTNQHTFAYKFLKYFRVGTLNLQHVKSSSIGLGSNFLLGNEFLENYSVVLDFINKQMILIPYKNKTFNLIG